jgi:fatty acid desaturase
MFFLSVIRFICEAGEHNYKASRTVFETSNIKGFIPRLLVYAHGDGYHIVHHLFPSMPLHKLKRTHEFLIAADRRDYGLRYMHRTKIFQRAFSEKEMDEEIEKRIAEQIYEVAFLEMSSDDSASTDCGMAIAGDVES